MTGSLRSLLVGSLPLLERLAYQLRRIGLGKLVDAVSARTHRLEFEIAVGVHTVAGYNRSHLTYVRDVLELGREQHLAELLSSAARPGSTIVDAGAYIGLLTLVAAAAVGREGHVLAIEPEPENRKALRRNISLNGYDDRVEIFPEALSDRQGEARFYSTLASDTSSLFGSREAHEEMTVTLATGDQLFAAYDVDVVKIDLEGGEVAALRGMHDVLARCRPILFVECNPHALQVAGSSADELIKQLTDAGYGVTWIDENKRALRGLHEHWDSEYVNLYCEPTAPL